MYQQKNVRGLPLHIFRTLRCQQSDEGMAGAVDSRRLRDHAETQPSQHSARPRRCREAQDLEFPLPTGAFQHQLVFAGHRSFQAIQCMQHTNWEGGAEAHAAARGKVAIVIDFHTMRQLHFTQHLEHCGMLNIVERIGYLNKIIDHPVSDILKTGVGSGN